MVNNDTLSHFNIKNEDLEQIKKDIEERDYRDMHREISPLKEAEDAIHMDSTGMEIDEEVAYILEFCKHARGE